MSRANPRFRRDNPVLPIALTNVWRVKFYGVLEGQMTLSSFYYIDSNTKGTNLATAQANLQAALPSIGGPLVTYGAACSSDWQFQSLVIDSPNNPTLSPLVTPYVTTGGGPAGHEPTTVAAVVARQTATKGQCGRGHVLVPAVPTAWVTDSEITTLTAYTALANGMKLTLTTGPDTFTPGIWSKGTRTVHQFGFDFLISATPRVVLGTCRRRKLGRGK